jgi:hypothetical protein
MFKSRRAIESKGRRPGFVRPHDEEPRALCFDDDDRPAGRIGDPRPEDEVMEEFPPSRERQAGLAGVPGGDVTADDLSPETLLDDDRSHSPSARDSRDALDTILRCVPETEIGAGNGPDEAEVGWPDSVAEHVRRQHPRARSG